MTDPDSQHRTPLPPPPRWVGKIFGEMRATYGSAFDRQWECPAGVDVLAHMHSVMLHWARALERFKPHPAAFRYALDNLPAFPPNLVEFVALCNRAPAAKPAEASAPDDAAPADVARVAEALGKLRAPQGASLGYRVWAVRLRDRERAGETLSRFAREAWREVLLVPAGDPA
jgi:hypothetical protein